MSFLFYLRWSLYHPVINLGLLFFSGGYPATLSEKEYIKFLEKKQVFSLKKAIPPLTHLSRKAICSAVWNQCSPPSIMVKGAPFFSTLS